MIPLAHLDSEIKLFILTDFDVDGAQAYNLPYFSIFDKKAEIFVHFQSQKYRRQFVIVFRNAFEIGFHVL